ncbi:MAG: hypothetical protein FWE63_01685 [Bacteroidales bacterium]|nr:hypothetical protein [Bacteroidales bacterium]
MLVGEIVFINNDYVSAQGISFKGVTTSGIEIVIVNIATNDVFYLRSDKNGFFSANLREGKYRIQRFHIKKERNDGAWSTLFTTPVLRILEIEKGKVNNLGKIQWVFANNRHTVVQEDSPDIKNEASRCISFNWNQEWKYKQLTFLKEPSEPTYSEINLTTLLVGEVVFTGINLVSPHGVSFDGIITSGIEISIRNTATSEVLRFSADKNGLFYVNLQEGKYWINEIAIKKQNDDGAWAYFFTNLNPPKIFEVERGKVNNIGTIHWSVIDRKHNVERVGNSSIIKNKFLIQFPGSIWNTKEWKYIP